MRAPTAYESWLLTGLTQRERDLYIASVRCEEKEEPVDREPHDEPDDEQ
jgi:hypothetical protein